MIKTYADALDEKALIDLGYRFHQESQYNDTPYYVEGIQKIIHATKLAPEKLFLAFDEDYHGVILLQMGTEFFNGLRFAIDHIFYVEPEYRGTSLAHELLRAGETWAKAHGAHDLVIMHNSGIGHTAAANFYGREGFEISGVIFNKKLQGI